MDRRRFLAWSGVSAAAALVAVAASRAVSAGSRAVQAVRESLRLPTPATPAPRVPPGADLGVERAEPYITPNETFYRIDTALRVPTPDPAGWSLTVTGLVDAPFTRTWDELLGLPLVEHHVTLTCVSATKWVTELKVTRFAADEAYWTPRSWSERGPIKLSSRIDIPRPGDDLPAGEVVVAGVAWAQHTGISGVEVRVDDGPWVTAELADTVGPDTWRQWRFVWDAPPGDHLVAVRATDADGVVQTGEPTPVAPDGATGWHTISLTIVRVARVRP